VQRFRGGLVFKAHRLLYQDVHLGIVEDEGHFERGLVVVEVDQRSYLERVDSMPQPHLEFRVQGLGFRVKSRGFSLERFAGVAEPTWNGGFTDQELGIRD